MGNKEHLEPVKQLKIAQLKKLTKYINHLKLTPRMRKFSWYYVFNGFNGANAAELAGYKAKSRKSLGVSASENLNKPVIKESIRLIIENSIGDIKDVVEKRLIDTWMIQAFYDPFMFIDEEGALVFDDPKQIPEEYRCCIESIETKYYGVGAVRKTTVIKLVDRKWAQEKLAKYISLISDLSVKHEHTMAPSTAENLKKVFRDRPRISKEDLVIPFPNQNTKEA